MTLVSSPSSLNSLILMHSFLSSLGGELTKMPVSVLLGCSVPQAWVVVTICCRPDASFQVDERRQFPIQIA